MSASACHIRGVWELRRSGRLSVIGRDRAVDLEREPAALEGRGVGKSVMHRG